MSVLSRDQMFQSPVNGFDGTAHFSELMEYFISDLVLQSPHTLIHVTGTGYLYIFYSLTASIFY